MKIVVNCVERIKERKRKIRKDEKEEKKGIGE